VPERLDGYGPMAILACLPQDQHDLGLICFGLALRAQGWRITFLGPDTPLATITATARSLKPGLVVLTAACHRPQDADRDDLAAITSLAPLALGGAGVTEHAASAAGALFLAGDPFTAAAAVSRALHAPGRTPPGTGEARLLDPAWSGCPAGIIAEYADQRRDRRSRMESELTYPQSPRDFVPAGFAVALSALMGAFAYQVATKG
jgi:hypothetical protein